MRDIKTSGHDLINNSKLIIEGKSFPNPLQNPRFDCIDLAKELIQAIEGEYTAQ